MANIYLAFERPLTLMELFCIGCLLDLLHWMRNANNASGTLARSLSTSGTLALASRLCLGIFQRPLNFDHIISNQ